MEFPRHEVVFEESVLCSLNRGLDDGIRARSVECRICCCIGGSICQRSRLIELEVLAMA